jgi:inhibitor of KinA
VSGAAAPRLLPAGDSGLLVRFEQEISPARFAEVMAALAALDARRPPGVLDVVPAFASLLVLYDPLAIRWGEVRAYVEAALEAALAAAGGSGASAPTSGPAARRVEIPVLYHPDVAPDLLPLAAEKGLSPEALVALHTAPEYRCHMLGFRPGFPFLGGLDPRLATPRLATPRPAVPAGSVAIGGPQTGVYPQAGPGGWRIVGRTPLRLFDPAGAAPFLLRPGDLVRFVPVDRARFDALAAAEVSA